MKRLILVLTIAVAAMAVWLGPIAFHHFAPQAWTGEAGRLALVIGASPGAHVAEIGAGRGAIAREMARAVGPEGRLYVTEMSADRQAQLAAMARDEGLAHVMALEARADATNLPSSCCAAVYMRNVLHHIGDWPGYARDLARTVAPNGAVAVIDFAPGALPHLASDHGAAPGRVIEAFGAAGLRLERRDDDWGGATYLLLFRRVE